MTKSVFVINKGINRSIEFHGLKSQYIWYMGGGMFALLIFYAVLYMAKVNTFLSLGITICLGVPLIMLIYHMSSTYGEHGLSKMLAKRQLPKAVRSFSRNVFVFRNPTTINL